jgi:hypothetical protein
MSVRQSLDQTLAGVRAIPCRRNVFGRRYLIEGMPGVENAAEIHENPSRACMGSGLF